MRLRGLRSAIAALAVAGAVAAGVVLTPSARSATVVPGHLASYGQTTTVGALFTIGGSGQLERHFCTGSVVDSPAGDLVVTAAHCMARQTAGKVAFVPDYSRGHEPYGVWTVTRIVEDAKWSESADPDDDFAFLVVSQPGSKEPLQDYTGGEMLGVGVPAGKPVEVAGYPDTADSMVSCKNTALAYSSTQFQFDCDGFTDGTSGSPLLADAVPAGASGAAAVAGADTVIGVIGGYEQGGDTASVSYAARFSSQLAALYQQAIVISASSAG